ncbi:MAG TPA: hypothetical protein V6C72_05415 [Chroococcales cyanobacterium]
MKRRVSALLTCLALLLCVPAPATTLVGEIEHSETLKPVESVLTPGQTFDQRNLPASQPQPDNCWYRIPTWLAGTWHKDEQVNYFRYWYRTKQEDISTHAVVAKSDGTWGIQRDDGGNYWQFEPTPFTTIVDGGNEFVVQLVRKTEPLECSERRFVRRSVDTQIHVDKLSNVIKGVESGEQISIYTPEMGNLIRRSTSAKVFDVQGQPVLLGKSYSYERKIAEFVPQDVYLGKNTKTLFQQFLTSQANQPAE